MKVVNQETLDTIMESLFTPYRERVPDVDKITKAMIHTGIIQKQDDIINDHIAFRTLGIPHLGITSFEKIFLHHGYEKRDHYYFGGKKLDAFWYAPPKAHYPRIFISELRVGDLSGNAQNIIAKYTAHIDCDPVDEIDLDDGKAIGDFFYKPLWDLPALTDYLDLMDESEYAAWVLYNRYYLNHYTISVHEFSEDYNSIEKFNSFLESIGIALNNSGGKVKTSKDGLLKQSSTIAKMIKAEFANGDSGMIAGSYVEFAERLALPEYANIPQNQLQNKHRRDGFESANADKIFESTYSEQTGNTPNRL